MACDSNQVVKSSKWNRKVLRIMTFVGCMLMLMPNGFMWYWGNLASYSLSYLAIIKDQTSNLESPWAISFFIVSWTTTLIFSNYISKYIARRWVILSGILVASLGPFLSYFSVEISMMALSATFGILLGIGTGLIYGNAMQLVLAVAGENVGFFSAVLQGSFPLGGVIGTQLVTWYMNPNNETANYRIGPTLYFTQKDILGRTRSMFIVQGLFNLSFYTVGYIMIQFNPSSKLKAHTKKDPENQNLITTNETKGRNEVQRDKKLTSFQTENDGTHISNGIEPHSPTKIENDPKNSTCNDALRDLVSSNPAPTPAPESSQNEGVDGTLNDYTPSQLLRTPQFYIMWICCFIGESPYILLTNYYKLYGQLWIHDDHFLTNMGTTVELSSAVTRLMWGVLLDRFGIKNSFILLMSSLVVVICLFCFAAMINRWLYFAVTLLFGTFGSAIYSCFMAATVKLFGKTHVSTNYGLIMTSAIVFNLMAPSTIGAAIGYFGWYYTFLISGFLTFIALILCMICIPSRV